MKKIIGRTILVLALAGWAGVAQSTIIQWRIDFAPADEPRDYYINVQSGYALVTFDTESTRVIIDDRIIQWWATDYKVVMDGITFLPDAQVLPNGQPLSVVDQKQIRKQIGPGPLDYGLEEWVQFDFELQNGAFFDAYIWSRLWAGESELLPNGPLVPADLPLNTADLNLYQNIAQVSLADGTIYSAKIARISAVPIPATLALFSIGLAGLGWSRRKKV